MTLFASAEFLGKGPEGDGTELFDDGGLHDGVRTQSVRAYYDGHGSIDGAWHLPPFSRRSPKPNGHATVQCPSAEPPTIITLRSAQWVRVTDRVWRKVRTAMAVPQTAVA